MEMMKEDPKRWKAMMAKNDVIHDDKAMMSGMCKEMMEWEMMEMIENCIRQM
jgi:hypothetical protein